uniref:Glycosyl hydrolase family 48 n=1 Tax=Eubacterium cellulosolvens (strain ATCC 43171 / JCM 9499 / 6) TaxID=633697 RepID=I5AVQ9_EUBC6
MKRKAFLACLLSMAMIATTAAPAMAADAKTSGPKASVADEDVVGAETLIVANGKNITDNGKVWEPFCGNMSGKADNKVKLMANISIDSINMWYGTSVEVDLNGYSIQINKDITIQDHASVKIYDSSDDAAGAIDLKTGQTNVSGDFVIEAGTFNFDPSDWATKKVQDNGDDTWSVGKSITTNPDATPTPAASEKDQTSRANVKDFTKNPNSKYAKRFKQLYNDMHNGDLTYFDKHGVPYHSVETLMAEAPDQGHESTSEAASYYVWLEAMNGYYTGNYKGVDTAWKIIDKYFIPDETHQSTEGNAKYNPNSPATPANEYDTPDQYPAELSGTAGKDPIYKELVKEYGDSNVYGMHWLIDCDNFYGFGDGSEPVFINTYQRGCMEGCFNTIPQPSEEDFTKGGLPNAGYLSYFTKEANKPSKQWKYTVASDADARVVQAVYDAVKWSQADGKGKVSSSAISKTTKLGDFLRYSMYDKYFRKIGNGKVNGTKKDSCDYLLNWYYAWGGGMDDGWSWRIGSSHAHFGYQNPLAAWILSRDNTGFTSFVPGSATAQEDWDKSYDTQLDFYTWLQSEEGGVAGGASNNYNGDYSPAPKNVSTFNGLAYTEAPVYHNPDSNQWFGMQTWSMQRIAELYYETGNEQAKALMDKWANWATSQLQRDENGELTDTWMPGTLDWSGQPGTWNSKTHSSDNSDLHVEVVGWNHDAGVTGSMANTLAYYAAGLKLDDATDGDGHDYEYYRAIADELLDKVWEMHTDGEGIGDPSVIDKATADKWFKSRIDIPEELDGGETALGDPINHDSTFLSIRSQYKDDPDYQKLVDAENGKESTIVYHRFWANCDVAIAMGVYDQLFGDVEDATPTPTKKPTVTPEPTDEPAPTFIPEVVKVVGRNLELKGKIGTVVYVDLPDEVREDGKAYGLFTLNGVETKVYFADCEQMEWKKGRTVYILPINCKAKETNSKIDFKVFLDDGRRAKLYDDDGVALPTYQYTVAKVCDTYTSSKVYSDEMKALASQIKDYGIYAQELLKFNNWSLKPKDDLSDVDYSDLEEYEATTTGTWEVPYSVSLSIVSDTTLSVAFKVDPDEAADYTFYIDNKKVKADIAGKYAYLDLVGVKAQDLGKAHTFRISNGTSYCQVTASGLSWSNSVMKNPIGLNTATKNMAKSVFKYNQAAVAYFDSVKKK